jgi:hypothetical protein
MTITEELKKNTDSHMREFIKNGTLDCIDIFDLEEFVQAFYPDSERALHYCHMDTRWDAFKELFEKHYNVTIPEEKVDSL